MYGRRVNVKTVRDIPHRSLRDGYSRSFASETSELFRLTRTIHSHIFVKVKLPALKRLTCVRVMR